MINPFKKINTRLEELVQQADFEKFKKEVIGSPKIDVDRWNDWLRLGHYERKDKTLFEEIDEIKESIKKIEEYLEIERKQTELKTDMYVRKPIKKLKFK